MTEPALPNPVVKKLCQKCGYAMEKYWTMREDSFWKCLSCGATEPTMKGYRERYGEN